MRDLYEGTTARAHRFRYVLLAFGIATIAFVVCTACGLQRHEPDAVHGKACGHLLNIPNEGAD